MIDNDENRDPQLHGSSDAHQQFRSPPTSRPKVRCLHRQHMNRVQPNARETSPLKERPDQASLPIPRPQSSPVAASTEAIPFLHTNAPHNRGGTGASRRESEPREETDTTTPVEGEKPPYEAKRQEVSTYLSSKQKPRSRPKIKCRFGPYHRQDEAPISPSHCDDYPPQFPSTEDPIPPPPLDDDPPDRDVIDPLTQGVMHSARSGEAGTRTHFQLQRSPDKITQQPAQAPEAIWLRADEGAPSHLEDERELHPHFPARVTLCPPAGPSRTPLDKYKASAEEAPRPNSKRFVLRKLGLSEAEFDARVVAEVDELLRDCRTERRLEQLEASSSTAPRVLSKEDAHFFFDAMGNPSSPALLGAYWHYKKTMSESRRPN